jgi:hypothetical protein
MGGEAGVVRVEDGRRVGGSCVREVDVNHVLKSSIPLKAGIVLENGGVLVNDIYISYSVSILLDLFIFLSMSIKHQG